MHHKAYLSEKEALYTSANLTADAVGKAVESAIRFDRATEASGWNQVFEIWQKTADEWRRGEEGEPFDYSDLLVELRTRAVRGDVSARDRHCFCIVCGETASQDDGEVVCLKCRAWALTDDRDPHDVPGERCTRCNGAYRGADPGRPLCGDCFQSERARDEQRPVRWYVSGESGRNAAWWGEKRGKGFIDKAQDTVETAVRERWAVLMEGCTSVRGTLVTRGANSSPHSLRTANCRRTAYGPPTGNPMTTLQNSRTSRKIRMAEFPHPKSRVLDGWAGWIRTSE